MKQPFELLLKEEDRKQRCVQRLCLLLSVTLTFWACWKEAEKPAAETSRSSSNHRLKLSSPILKPTLNEYRRLALVVVEKESLYPFFCSRLAWQSQKTVDQFSSPKN